MLLTVALALASPYLDWQATQAPVAHPEPRYHYAAEVHAELAPLVRERSGVIWPFEIGRSVEDRPIWAFRVKVPGVETKRRLLVFANIHAMEWVPTEVAGRFLEELVLHPIAGLEVVVVPTLNVDGRARVEEDLVKGENTYRRGNARKVDLNRDFAVNREARAIWKAIIPGRYTTSKEALSQPEAQAIDHLAAGEHFDVAVSLHAFGGFIYYPWAGLWERPKDWATFHQIGEVMQAGMGAHAYRPRQLSRWGFFFRGHGMELDHLYATYGTYAFLVETTRSGLSPFRPQDWGNRFRFYNPTDPTRHRTEGAAMLRSLAYALSSR